LESEKNLLDARLREALSAQPATVDPRELARAETRIRGLEKENDLLKVTLDQEQARMANLVDPALMTKTQKALADANQRLADQTRQVSLLTQEKHLLESRLQSQAGGPELQALQAENAQLKQQVANLNAKPDRPKSESSETRRLKSQLDRQEAELDTLRAEKRSLERQVSELKQLPVQEASAKAQRSLAEERARVETLRAEKRSLERQLAELKAGGDSSLSRRERMALAEHRATAESLREDNRNLEREKKSLETELADLKKRVQELQARPPAVVSSAPPVASREIRATSSNQDADRIRSLEKERDALKRRLDSLLRELNTLKNRPDQARWQQLSNQVGTLQARLDALEAQKVPYSPEELALMRAPLAPVSATNTPAAATTTLSKKAAPVLPSGAGPIVAEAQRAFAAGRYDEAEQKYQQVLTLDNQNVYTLGNLAAIQIEQKKYDEAEIHLKKAMELDPNDAFNLSLYGILKFRQSKFDDALTALSQSARLDPKNAETQNYLGITLSEKGFRDAAETALRRAIHLQPDYANAHHNIAVIYATQNPPYLELARWHYQKALASGHPRNLDMEKILLERKPGASSIP
jgi:tetratricopeptide (TPR) repeat protein